MQRSLKISLSIAIEDAFLKACCRMNIVILGWSLFCLSGYFWGVVRLAPLLSLVAEHCIQSGSFTRCSVTRPRWAEQINISCFQRAEGWRDEGNGGDGGNQHTYCTISPYCEEVLHFPLHSVPCCCEHYHTEGWQSCTPTLV